MLRLRCASICLVLVLMSWLPPQIASADAAPPPDPTVAGVGPYRPIDTHVRMMSETVFIDVPPQTVLGEPAYIAVSASFIMQNQGDTQERMQVIFPITRLNFWTTEEALYRVDMSSFTVRVDGKPATITEITTPPELQGVEMDRGYVPDVHWAAFEAAFPVQQDVLLQIDYRMLNDYGLDGSPASGFTGIAYILETGAGWYGTIGSADIRVHLPYPATPEAIETANPGYSISNNELRWQLRDFEPARTDNLELRVINSVIWNKVLDLRARVERNPAHTEAWAELGELYMGLGIHMMSGGIAEANPHFVELALRARRKAVELDPNLGEAHFKLAEILWLGHPAVQARLRAGRTATPVVLSRNDPVIREALAQLELSHTLGYMDSLPGLEQAFPELVLTPPMNVPATIPVSTETPLPVSTQSSLSTQSVQIVAQASPTLQPVEATSPITKEVMAAAVLSMVIGAGTLYYLWRSRPRRFG